MRIFNIRFLTALVVFAVLVLTSCKHRNDFEVRDFKPMVNWQDSVEGIKTIYLDYKGSLQNGFIIPSVRQTKNGRFVFSFSIRNFSGDAKNFFYKIYYQDESYKFPEYVKRGKKIIQDSLADENFYGSWEQVSVGFKASDVIPGDGHYYTVKDSFRIVGNPRDEDRYYDTAFTRVPEDSIKKLVAYIKTNVEWYNSIKKKAKEQKRTEEQQLHMDAEWSLKSEIKKVVLNNRWQRNPRVGKYSFMLVVTSEANIEHYKIPDYVQHINKKDSNTFVNPYFYFLHGKGDSLAETKIIIAADTLKVIAKPDLGGGFYVNTAFDSVDNVPANTSCFGGNCGNNAKLHADAPFEQYFNAVDPNVKIDNVPVNGDVTGDGYTLSDYKNNNYPEDKLVKTPLYLTDCPCKTVSSDSVHHTMRLTNPASPEGKWRKEDVGIVSRDGFTYGKYYFKVKLPSLLNKTKLWNGLTDAIWLIFQKNEPWNNRRFAPGGYIPKDEDKEPYHRKQTAYTEIDFEILKAAHYWPHTSYHKDAKRIPEETPADSGNIMVTYTNWDLACRDVSHYTVGADSIKHNGKYYGIHRWDDDYKALTGKDAENNDSIFKQPYYYFEIDWEPTEIIWSIGPSKDKMKIIGYMNDSVTAIPNNQMVMVITQEFHLSKWWPNLPYPQEKIPFPSKDIIGDIYEIEIQ